MPATTSNKLEIFPIHTKRYLLIKALQTVNPNEKTSEKKRLMR